MLLFHRGMCTAVYYMAIQIRLNVILLCAKIQIKHYSYSNQMWCLNESIQTIDDNHNFHMQVLSHKYIPVSVVITKKRHVDLKKTEERESSQFSEKKILTTTCLSFFKILNSLSDWGGGAVPLPLEDNLMNLKLMQWGNSSSYTFQSWIWHDPLTPLLSYMLMV